MNGGGMNRVVGMATEGLKEPGEGAHAVGAEREWRGLRAEKGRTTTVPVIPLWNRPRTGVCG